MVFLNNVDAQVFIRFLSPSAVMYGVEMDGVARYLAEKRNRVFMNWEAMVFPRSGTIEIFLFDFPATVKNVVTQ